MRPLRFPAVWLALGWLQIGLIITGSVISFSAAGPAVSDKALHFFAYAALAVWFGGIYERRNFGWLALGLFSLGAAIELVQGMLPHRSLEAGDLLADALGIGAGLVLTAGAPGRWCHVMERLVPR